MSSEFEFDGFFGFPAEKIGTLTSCTVCIPGTFSTCTTIYSEVLYADNCLYILYRTFYNQYDRRHKFTNPGTAITLLSGTNTVQTRVLLLHIVIVMMLLHIIL